MDLCDINILFSTSDGDYFRELLDQDLEDCTSEYQGILEASFVGVPSDLNDYMKRRFFGYHKGYSGSYCGKLFFCRGDDNIHTHDCDDDGDIVMAGTKPFNNESGASEYSIDPDRYAYQFINGFRQLMVEMGAIKTHVPLARPIPQFEIERRVRQGGLTTSNWGRLKGKYSVSPRRSRR